MPDQADVNAANAANAAAVKVRDDAAKKVQEDLKKQREDRAKMNEEVMAKQASYRPTPTVEEIQNALAGNNADEKESDGSAEQNVHHVVTPVQTQIEVGHKVAEAKPSHEKAGYVTRAAAPTDKPKT